MRHGSTSTGIVSIACCVIAFGACGGGPRLVTSVDRNADVSSLSDDERRQLLLDANTYRGELFDGASLCRLVIMERLAPEWTGGVLSADGARMCTNMLLMCTGNSTAGALYSLTEDLQRYEGCGATVDEVISCWEPELRAIADWANSFDCQHLVILDPPASPRACLILRDRC